MEKKSILAILLIFAIIVICVMGGYIYKLYSEKQVNEIETDKLKTEITNLNNKNNELQEKIDNVSNAINSNMALVKNGVSAAGEGTGNKF